MRIFQQRFDHFFEPVVLYLKKKLFVFHKERLLPL